MGKNFFHLNRYASTTSADAFTERNRKEVEVVVRYGSISIA